MQGLFSTILQAIEAYGVNPMINNEEDSKKVSPKFFSKYSAFGENKEKRVSMAAAKSMPVCSIMELFLTVYMEHMRNLIGNGDFKISGLFRYWIWKP